MAKIKKHKNDKFYTKDNVAKKLISLIKLDDYYLIIEPSAGNGSFSKNINHSNVLAMDIEPEYTGILKMDWFNFILFLKKGKVLVIGNPPFGTNGNLALKFIKKCDDLKINTIAFILPKSFKKDSIKNRIPLNYHLIKEIDLENNSFTLLGKDYDVPCIFQIWDRKNIKRQKQINKTTSNLITFVKKTDNPDYSFRRVGINAGLIYDKCDDKSEQSHYFIKSSKKIKNIIKTFIWQHNNTTGPRSIGKGELIKKLNLELNK